MGGINATVLARVQSNLNETLVRQSALSFLDDMNNVCACVTALPPCRLGADSLNLCSTETCAEQLSVDGARCVFDQCLFCVGVWAGVQPVNAAKRCSYTSET